MYIYRSPEEKFKITCLAVAISLFDKTKVNVTIKEMAEETGVSEKQLHVWKNALIAQGPKILFSSKPGRKKEKICILAGDEKLLIYEAVNHVLTKYLKNCKITVDFKRRILHLRKQLKRDFNLSYEEFAQLIGLSSRQIIRWANRLKLEGEAGLEDKSRAPKYSPEKLTVDVIVAIEDYGRQWLKKHHGWIKIGAFAESFRHDKRRLLTKYGKANLCNKTIIRYLKEALLYGKAAKKQYEAKRGNFRYYWPGAQLLIDTTFYYFFGLKVAIVGLMDAFSRQILHQEGFRTENASAVVRTLKKGIKTAETLGLSIQSVLSDHGRPYKSKKVWAYLRNNSIRRIYSAPYWPQGKAAIERYFRTLKEGLAGSRQLLNYLFKGFIITVREKFLLCCLNLVLIGFNGKYSITPNPGIDGKSPQQRLGWTQETRYQAAVSRVLEEDERNSELKSELIAKIYKEFKLEVSLVKAKGYLAGCSKESITKAAEALRRKLVREDLKALNRWQYWSKTSKIIEGEKREAQLSKARQVIAEKKKTDRARQERERIEDQRRWSEAHPEETLNEAIEWQLVFWGNKFTAGHYESMIKNSLEPILMKHSKATAGLRVKKICENINKKNRLESKEILKSNYKLPEPEKLAQAKAGTIKLIQDIYTEFKDEIPRFQGIKQLWSK